MKIFVTPLGKGISAGLKLRFCKKPTNSNKPSAKYRFQQTRSKVVHCKFMDGNYRLDVETANSNETLNISFIKDAGHIDNVKYQGNVNSEQFSREILRVIKLIQDECRKSKNYEAVDRIEVSIEKFVEAKDIFTH